MALAIDTVRGASWSLEGPGRRGGKPEEAGCVRECQASTCFGLVLEHLQKLARADNLHPGIAAHLEQASIPGDQVLCLGQPAGGQHVVILRVACDGESFLHRNRHQFRLTVEQVQDRLDVMLRQVVPTGPLGIPQLLFKLTENAR